MGALVAEYYGKRTDASGAIEPVMFPDKPEKWPEGAKIPPCPFSCGNTCKKLKSQNEPVCSVRDQSGTLWLVCSERLCATKKDIPLCAHQQKMLYDIARHVFSKDIDFDDVCVKREEPLSVIEGTNYHADYIMTTRSGRSSTSGPDRVVLEMQGGGETTNTGKLTSHVKSWKRLPSSNRENGYLSSMTAASPLVTNAWRRQQEQFLVKGNIAMKTWKGLGIAFCVGTLLYDYLMDRLKSANLPDLSSYNWTLALIAIKEDSESEVADGPIPLKVDESRILYTNYQTFVQALINQGEPSMAAFTGGFIDLHSRDVEIPF